MAILTYGQAKCLFNKFVTSQGETDPIVGEAINFVNERLISSGQWRGNRFIKSFSVQQDSDGNYYFDTIEGVESIIKVIAIDSEDYGEIVTIQDDWYPFDNGGLGWMSPTYVGDTQIFRQGNVPASASPTGTTSDTQRYRIVGRVPENRTMYCLVRRGYVPLVNDADLVIPNSRNAMRYGMQAYNYENVNELERAQLYWDYAPRSLNDETIASMEGVDQQIDVQMKAFAPSLIQNLI
jgi:hypothetical protein